jgi:hypothetical protein
MAAHTLTPKDWEKFILQGYNNQNPYRSMIIRIYAEFFDGESWHPYMTRREPNLPVLQSWTSSALFLERMFFMTKGHPFAWAERGVPEIKSPALASAYESIHSQSPNLKRGTYVTREEILNKLTELLIYPHEEALEFRQKLSDFFEKMPSWDGDPKHQRIHFWMT